MAEAEVSPGPEERGTDALAAAIVDAMAIPDYGNVYGVGVRATRLTFQSQQHRALNLVWALRHQGKLPKGARVAVIGGGLAGVTAAVAARLLDARVTLLERKGDILHLQRGSQLRFIHPNIYDWPMKGSEEPFTDLPFFNWGAGMAAAVIESILHQWGELAGEVEGRLNHDVRELLPGAGGRVTVVAEGPLNIRSKLERAEQALPAEGIANFRETFDVVLLAVGFGLERPLSTVPFRSYWENDNLGRAVITGPVPRYYLVTGCGDGGLIDAIRLRIRGFDHAQFVYDVLSLPGFQEIRAKFDAIDADAAQLSRSGAGQAEIEARVGPADASSEPDRARRRLRALRDLEGDFIEQQYDEIFAAMSAKTLQDIVRVLAGKLRDDTVVYLNSPQRSPMSLRTSILNRIAVYLLYRHGGLRYRQGEVVVSEGSSTFRIVFRRDHYPPEELDVHEVVVRHGPAPAFSRLLPEPIRKRLTPIEAVHDATRLPRYPVGFWADKRLEPLRRAARRRHAAQAFSRAVTVLLPDTSGASIAMKVGERDVEYVLTGEANSAVVAAEENVFDGVPVIRVPVGAATAAPAQPSEAPAPTAPAPAPPRSSTRRRAAGRSKKGAPEKRYLDVIHCGMGIAGESPWRLARTRPLPGFGTLCCFVRLPGGARGLLTASMALGMGWELPGPLEEFVVVPTMGERRVARVVRVIQPVLSAPGASLGDNTAIINQFDAAIAELSPDCVGTNEFQAKVPAIRDVDVPRLGDTVFKVGLGSGLTRGRISALQVQSAIQGGRGVAWFDGLFEVENVGAPRFSRPGDGGAAIVRQDGVALGLLIAANEAVTLAAPLHPLLGLLQCTLQEQG